MRVIRLLDGSIAVGREPEPVPLLDPFAAIRQTAAFRLSRGCRERSGRRCCAGPIRAAIFRTPARAPVRGLTGRRQACSGPASPPGSIAAKIAAIASHSGCRSIRQRVQRCSRAVSCSAPLILCSTPPSSLLGSAKLPVPPPGIPGRSAPKSLTCTGKSDRDRHRTGEIPCRREFPSAAAPRPAFSRLISRAESPDRRCGRPSPDSA